MDKVKEYMAVVVKYHFWGVAAVVIILGMFAWYVATGTLNQEYEANKGKIDGAMTKAGGVAGLGNHPNAESEAGMKALIDERRRDVLGAWGAMYENQKTTLIWPAELQQDFLDEINRILADKTSVKLADGSYKDKLAFEQIDPEANNKERDIAHHLRERYRNYITDELPKLAEMIKAPWNPGNMNGGGAENPGGLVPPAIAGGPMKAVVDPYLLDWNTANQTEIQGWFYFNGEVPSTLDVLYAQEDLWALKAIMQVLADTNGSVDARHKAAIRKIHSIQIGQRVGARAGTITPYVKPLAPGEAGAPNQVRPAAPPPAAPPPVAAPGAAPTGKPHPANLRYVDDKYELLAAEALLTGAATKDAANAYLAVAKRMPIRLQLIMDTRKLPKLLALCGNSNLPIEVQQVRINAPWATGGAVNNPGFPPGGVGGRGEGGAFVRPPGGIAAPPGGGDFGGMDKKAGVFPYDANVEIYGIIYIFNPVNAQKLGAAEGEDLSGLLPPATPTTPPATPTPMGTTPAPMGTTPVPMGTTPAPMGVTPMPAVPGPMPAVPGPMPAVPGPMPMVPTPAVPMAAPMPAPAVPMPVPAPAVPAPMPAVPAPMPAVPAPMPAPPMPAPAVPAPPAPSDIP